MEQKLASLPPFTCLDDGDTVDLWPGSPTGNYSEANAIGRTRAQELIDVIRRTGSVVLLTHVFETIAKKGQFGGMEIGFFHGLSLELLNPEKIVEFVSVPPERQFRLGRKHGPLAVVVSDNGDAKAAAVA
jgi:hypothetical protein